MAKRILLKSLIVVSILSLCMTIQYSQVFGDGSDYSSVYTPENLATYKAPQRHID